MQGRTHIRTNRRTSRKYSASGSCYWLKGAIKISLHYWKNWQNAQSSWASIISKTWYGLKNQQETLLPESDGATRHASREMLSTVETSWTTNRSNGVKKVYIAVDRLVVNSRDLSTVVWVSSTNSTVVDNAIDLPWRNFLSPGFRTMFQRKKGSSYRSVVFRSWSRFLAVSLQVTWIINPTVGCHYFPPGLQLPPQPLRGLLPISLLGEQRGTMGVNSLPKTVARQRRGCDLNPGPTVPESSTLTTRLPSHPSQREVL